MHRFVIAIAGTILLLLSALTPARAATAIYYSVPASAYGWCAGYAAQKARSCAEEQCVKNDGTDCRPAVACSTGGWGAVAFADGDVRGFGASCGMSDAFWARVVALAECIDASKTICWTDSTFDSQGNTQSKASDHRFDLIYYAQTLLQVRNYKPGSTDGTIGAQTVLAVKQLQGDLGRPQTGTIDDELVARLYDAVGGGPQLALITRRDFLDPKRQTIGDFGFASADPPATTFGEQLAARSSEDRLLALATLISTSGVKCTLPALDAEVLGKPADQNWNVQCKEGWYTLILSSGKRTIMTGKSTASDTSQGGKAVTPATDAGASPDASGSRDLSVSHPR
jgi:peptidoglycan hydrolase-like protein with peptidoglycan-binding domain